MSINLIFPLIFDDTYNRGEYMALLLGKIGRKIVKNTLISPRAGKAADKLGPILPRIIGLPYKTGLTRTAFQLSGKVKAGDVLSIRSGQIVMNDECILENKALFGGMQIDKIDVTKKMLTPEGMASYLRWGVFYDKKKVIKFLSIFAAFSAANIMFTTLLNHMWGAIDSRGLVREAYCPIIGNSDGPVNLAFLPAFHSLNDDSSTFMLGQFQKHIFNISNIFPLLAARCIISSASEFHKKQLIITSKFHKIMSKVSNHAAALTLSSFATSAFLLSRDNGAWDYIAVKLGEGAYANILNINDLTMLTFGPILAIEISMHFMGTEYSFSPKDPE